MRCEVHLSGHFLEGQAVCIYEAAATSSAHVLPFSLLSAYFSSLLICQEKIMGSPSVAVFFGFFFFTSSWGKKNRLCIVCPAFVYTNLHVLNQTSPLSPPTNVSFRAEPCKPRWASASRLLSPTLRDMPREPQVYQTPGGLPRGSKAGNLSF